MFALARYRRNGTLDKSFNGTGTVTTAVGLGAEAQALVLQPDGKLVAAGGSISGSQSVFALARYNPDGSLDTSFNGTGKVTTAVGLAGEVFALALQPDGKLVAAGTGGEGFALARYNPDGSLDASFNGTGTATTPIGLDVDIVSGLVLQPDGRLVVAGGTFNGSEDVFALARFNPNGSLDTSFNGTGKVTTAMGIGAEAHALALQPDGKLVAAGANWNPSRTFFALARYRPNGTLDTSFNGTGKVTTKIGSANGIASAVALQPDGKLVAAGYAYGVFPPDFEVARYNRNGTLDKSFNGGGRARSAIGEAADVASALVLQPDGRLVAAGWSESENEAQDRDFALARYLGKYMCDVPKVTGRTLAAGKRAIWHAHCAVGKVTTAFSREIEKGRVISQKPVPGKKLTAGSKVTITISRGKRL